MIYADIILPIPIATYTYGVADEMVAEVAVGKRVEVPLGKSKVHIGIIARIHSVNPSAGVVKNIRKVIDTEAFIDQLQIDIWLWMAQYYMTPPGEVYRQLVPSFFRTYSSGPQSIVGLKLVDPNLTSISGRSQAQEDLKKCKSQLAALEKFIENIPPDAPLTPVSRSEVLASLQISSSTIVQLCKKGYLEQVKISPYAPLPGIEKVERKAPHPLEETITNQLQQKPVLLVHQQSHHIEHKGQLYRSLIESQKAQGKVTVILTPDNFSAGNTFDAIDNATNSDKNRLALYTSRTSQGRRSDIFFAVAQGHLDVVVGTRVALFLPYKTDKIGLIIVEQEENFAYKQSESSPRYNGRDMAVVMGQMSHAAVILQSETPSMESYMMARGGKWGYLKLTSNEPSSGPKFMVLDRGKDLVSKYLINRLEEVTAQGKQAIVFQNRRGFSQYTECEQCYYTPQCPNCSVSLTYHKSQNALMCHYCGHATAMVEKCPSCGSLALRQSGIGTQRLEEKLQEQLPTRRVSRLDFDNTRRTGAFQEIAYDFASNKSDIMVGTKLMLNGLDFSNVALVCIANADIMFSSSDFRGGERAFALLTQLSNRVMAPQGEVIIQTSKQNSPIINQAINQATDLFYDTELRQRQELNYPPSVRMMIIALNSNDIQLLKQAAARCDAMLRPTFGSRLSPFFEPSVYKIACRYTLHQMLRIERTRSSVKAKEILGATIASLRQQFGKITIYVDVDPI